MKPNFKPILCLDFDGTIHDYKHGWKEGVIYGNVTPGFFEWADRAKEKFKLVVYSSRSCTEAGLKAMRDWMVKQLGEKFLVLKDENPAVLEAYIDQHFEFTATKPPAWLTIDDRCIRFEGNWSDPELDPEAMIKFAPWMARS